MRGRMRRLGVLTTTLLAASAIAAGPVYAHFCFKTGWNQTAAAKASKSQAWMSGADWMELVEWAEGEGFICPAGATIVRDALDAAPSGTLYMGPGLLAGGTLKNGKGNTPAHFGYLPLGEAFAACGEEGDGHGH